MVGFGFVDVDMCTLNCDGLISNCSINKFVIFVSVDERMHFGEIKSHEPSALVNHFCWTKCLVSVNICIIGMSRNKTGSF